MLKTVIGQLDIYYVKIIFSTKWQIRLIILSNPKQNWSKIMTKWQIRDKTFMNKRQYSANI